MYQLTLCPMMATPRNSHLMNVETPRPTARERLYARSRRSIPSARAFTLDTLHAWQLDVPLEDVLLCVSELTTNAFRYGVPPGRYFLLRLRRHGATGLRIEVHDSGTGTLPVVPVPTDEGGRGLLLVATLATRWGSEKRQPGKVVWAEFEG